ncbi:PREDICTED: uncharacterized protein LOC105964574 [Erythranthe guttata]|uniref:uncharacterized protein LOC105964574 n=1 Tax=Erythranthe guttata TaxID=4155 RepID=UPI00064DCB1C|nr:PREDICTED: uncharacterized protein LOC105964574 [Erythranthe guttata]|eukprot:XP_012844536.1 PREDICTED: uncharacterized protein LOC105964574 [Erythranthe guttata]
MTITLHDVQMILGANVEGRVVAPRYDEVIERTNRVYLLSEVLNFNFEEIDESWKHGGPTWRMIQGQLLMPDTPMRRRVQIYLVFLLGSILFPDKTCDRVKPWYMHVLEDSVLHQVGTYSWGSACLANLYRELGICIRAQSRSLAGCTTLLQCWIYEYFPRFQPPDESDRLSGYRMVGIYTRVSLVRCIMARSRYSARLDFIDGAMFTLSQRRYIVPSQLPIFGGMWDMVQTHSICANVYKTTRQLGEVDEHYMEWYTDRTHLKINNSDVGPTPLHRENVRPPDQLAYYQIVRALYPITRSTGQDWMQQFADLRADLGDIMQPAARYIGIDQDNDNNDDDDHEVQPPKRARR